MTKSEKNHSNPYYSKEIKLYDEIEQIKNILYKLNASLPSNDSDDIKLDRGIARFGQLLILEDFSNLKRKTMYEYFYRENYTDYNQLYILLTLFGRLTWYDINTAVGFYDFVFTVVDSSKDEKIVTMQHITDYHGKINVSFE